MLGSGGTLLDVPSLGNVKAAGTCNNFPPYHSSIDHCVTIGSTGPHYIEWSLESGGSYQQGEVAPGGSGTVSIPHYKTFTLTIARPVAGLIGAIHCRENDGWVVCVQGPGYDFTLRVDARSLNERTENSGAEVAIILGVEEYRSGQWVEITRVLTPFSLALPRGRYRITAINPNPACSVYGQPRTCDFHFWWSTSGGGLSLSDPLEVNLQQDTSATAWYFTWVPCPPGQDCRGVRVNAFDLDKNELLDGVPITVTYQNGNQETKYTQFSVPVQQVDPTKAPFELDAPPSFNQLFIKEWMFNRQKLSDPLQVTNFGYAFALYSRQQQLTLSLEALCGPDTPEAGQQLTGIRVGVTPPPGTVLTTPARQNYAPNTSVELEALDLQLVACHQFGAPIEVFFSHWEIDGVPQPAGRVKVTLTLTRDTMARAVYTMSRCARLETDKQEYGPGELVTIRFINGCQVTLTLPNTAPWRIKDGQGRIVFTPPSLPAITEVPPGETRNWLWNKRDQAGHQIPAGTYIAELETMDAGRYTTSFNIKGIPNPGFETCYDLNGDGRMDIADIQSVANYWHLPNIDPDWNVPFDLDRDGDVDIVDIMLVAARWGSICS
jgi:hypothetical protein